MSGIIGEICETQSDLKKTFSRRKKEYDQTSVPNSQADNLVQQSWQVYKQGKTRTKLRKPKKADELFEDRVWQLFYNLKFEIMNKDRNFKLNLGTYTQQVDVIAKDSDNVFVVECKSSDDEGPVNAKDALEEFVGK